MGTFGATDFNLGRKRFGLFIHHLNFVILRLGGRGTRWWSCTRFDGKLVTAIGTTNRACITDRDTKPAVALRA